MKVPDDSRMKRMRPGCALALGVLGSRGFVRAAACSAAWSSLLLTAVTASRPLLAQSTPGDGAHPPTAALIDTVVIVREDLFSDEAASESPFLQLFNDIHATTKPWVISRELLLHRGMPYDSARAAESERNLRRLGLFREVRVDTGRVAGKLAAIVRTKDAWSIKPRVEARLAADGTLTGAIGLTETNLGGTGNLARIWYVRDVDRDGLVLAGRIDRLGRSRTGVGASFANLSDRRNASWGAGNGFRTFSDRWSFTYGGEYFDGRVNQFRVETYDPERTPWERRALVNRAFLSYAPVASPTAYVRVGGLVEVRREEYFPAPDPALEPDSGFAVPDTVYGMVGAFIEYRRARYVRLNRFNGFTEEDQNLSPFAFLQVNLAPSGLGWRQTGVGARLALGGGTRIGPTLLKGAIDVNGLFTRDGLDSGRVVASATAGLKSGERHATFFHILGGVLDSPPPGGEFDLGFEVLPRLWGPHAFVGTRSIRGTLEHRFYAWDDLLSLVGLGFGAFVDYGGAWYADQDARLGGDAGLTLFIGSPLGATPQIAHISVGHRFGGGIDDSRASRWAVSLGSGIIF